MGSCSKAEEEIDEEYNRHENSLGETIETVAAMPMQLIRGKSLVYPMRYVGM